MRDPITMSAFADEQDTEKTDSSRYKLSKGNISFAPLGRNPDAPVQDGIQGAPLGDISNMPEARRVFHPLEGRHLNRRHPPREERLPVRHL